MGKGKGTIEPVILLVDGGPRELLDQGVEEPLLGGAS